MSLSYCRRIVHFLNVSHIDAEFWIVAANFFQCRWSELLPVPCLCVMNLMCIFSSYLYADDYLNSSQSCFFRRISYRTAYGRTVLLIYNFLSALPYCTCPCAGFCIAAEFCAVLLGALSVDNFITPPLITLAGIYDQTLLHPWEQGGGGGLSDRMVNLDPFLSLINPLLTPWLAGQQSIIPTIYYSANWNQTLPSHGNMRGGGGDCLVGWSTWMGGGGGDCVKCAGDRHTYTLLSFYQSCLCLSYLSCVYYFIICCFLCLHLFLW